MKQAVEFFHKLDIERIVFSCAVEGNNYDFVFEFGFVPKSRFCPFYDQAATESSASMALRISNFCALPVTVIVKASTIFTWRGTL